MGAGIYTVTVTDAKGCSDTEEIEIEDPEEFIIDMGDEYVLCVGQVLEIGSDVVDATYSWQSSNGFTSIEQAVVIDQGGEYSLAVVDPDGCVAQDDFSVIISNDLLQADLLMVSEAYTGDTVVIIDISWPVPERLSWDLGAGATVLMENKDYAEVVFKEPGNYTVNIETGLALCTDTYTQSISITDRPGKPNENGRTSAASEPLITTFKVYPNPSDGQFEVSVVLSSPEAIGLAMIDLEGNQIVLSREYESSQEFQVPIDIPRLSPGIYLLSLRASGENKVLRVMIK